jgi:hypothetical protein
VVDDGRDFSPDEEIQGINRRLEIVGQGAADAFYDGESQVVPAKSDLARFIANIL